MQDILFLCLNNHNDYKYPRKGIQSNDIATRNLLTQCYLRTVKPISFFYSSGVSYLVLLLWRKIYGNKKGNRKGESAEGRKSKVNTTKEITTQLFCKGHSIFDFLKC